MYKKLLSNFLKFLGAFSYFCQDVLMAKNCVHIPDYTVKVVEDCLIIKVTRAIYKQALISTKLKTLDTEDKDDEYEAHVIYDEDDDDSDSNSTELSTFTTPSTTPKLRRADKPDANNVKI